MPFQVTMPKLSPTMEEGTIAKWYKKEGEFIQAGEVLVEITTDKATVEHSALDEGWLKKILVPVGKSASINQPIAIFTVEEKESIEGFEIPHPQKKATPSPTPNKTVDQSVPETPSQPRQEPVFIPEPPLENYVFPQTPAEMKASPLAKKLAKEQGLDLTTVKGSGPGGRIESEDLKGAPPAGMVSFGRQSPPQIAPGSYEEIPLTPIRKVIGKKLQASKSFIPHFYVSQKINAQSLVELREELKKLHLPHITYNDMIIRGAALALRRHPGINTGFNSQSQSIIHFKTIDIAVAVTLEGGLITPIIRHADYKNLGELSSEVKLLAEKARQGKLQEKEYRGGSFTISNLGMAGISEFIAVINPPQAAILAIGGIQEEPVVCSGQVVAGKTLTVTISCDHRVIDGMQAAQFLKTFKELLENPVALTI